MPLWPGKSRRVIAHNYRVERAAGKPPAQARAIALNKANVRRRRKPRRPKGWW